MKAALPALVSILALAACVPATKAPPPSTPAPAQRPAPARPAPTPVIQAPPNANWVDAPLTPGAWVYGDQNGGGMALFSNGRGEPLFMLECDRETGPAILLAVIGNAEKGAVAVVRTETATRTLPLSAVSGAHQTMLDPHDPLLDAIALSKGHFAIEAGGLAPLILPSHAEVSRVIEDCR